MPTGVSRLRPRCQAGIHIVLLGLAALWLPIGLTDAMPPAEGEPAFWVPWFLISSIGPLFFIVSAQAPLMQRWYALETSRGDPYPLYAASNLGSFAGLISYPLLVEPLMSLQQQSWLWTALYALLVLLVVALRADRAGRRGRGRAGGDDAARRPRGRSLHWIVLAAVPSGLMLSTTTHLTTDIVAMPLLWVLPLGLYLLSFVIAFAARRRPAEFDHHAGAADHPDRRRPRLQRRHPQSASSRRRSACCCCSPSRWRCIREMFRLRPAVGHLTRFYLAMSFGGMLGGLFCAIVAPLVFDWAYEHPLLILAAAVLVPQIALVPWPKSLQTVLGLALPVFALLLLCERARAVSAIATDRRRWSAASSSRCSRWPASAGAGPSWSASPP